jgi:hypothetical protein
MGKDKLHDYNDSVFHLYQNFVGYGAFTNDIFRLLVELHQY